MEKEFSDTAKYNEAAVIVSESYKGKTRVIPKVPIRDLSDFSIYYTPGIAEVSRRIAADPGMSFELTGRWNSVAILTDGTRVLGLGNVGPHAAMPVMEGKALIFNYLGGVNAVPITMMIRSSDEFMAVARALEPSFGGYNLEDIESPKCFFLLQNLQKELNIPVWHDDQLGTASITLAGLTNALKVTGRRREDSWIVLLGSGAANIATATLLGSAGFDLGKIILVDSHGILHPEREDMDSLMINHPWKYDLAMKTNSERIKGGAEEALKGADIVISAAKSQPGFIKKEWIRSMNRDPIVFALANPLPEIWPNDAKEAGASVVATGRGDFPNQINNSLVFPAVFRGVLDARAKGVNMDVMVTASNEIAAFVKVPSEDHIVPSMNDWEMYPQVAAAVAAKTSEIGLARKNGTRGQFLSIATDIIEENRRFYQKAFDNGLIKDFRGVIEVGKKN
ncbi:MAG: NADP-dependent malic enzyme [Candidatus Thermoplasmatota archaeon]|nr:NADP-dependent malic enzyme [Candidatus Thermoplasmatota archaeon]